MSYTRKRPELGSEQTKAKARLVAKDLKVIYKRDKVDTYAPTPTAEGFRLIVASTDVEAGDELSSTDFDTAFLQAFRWQGKLMLIVYHDAFLGRDVYEWINGVIYGMQTGGADWKNTLAFTLATEMGFKEVKNMESMYHHPERKITVPCHVDDPLVKSRGTENREWFHNNINKLFDTKGSKLLSVGQPLDYLSMRISMNSNGDISLDNSIKIEAYLQELGLGQANPVKEPISKAIVKLVHSYRQDGEWESEEVREKIGHYLGEAQWLAQTTHPVICTAVSMYATLLRDAPKGSMDAVKHLFRYLKGVQYKCLRKKAGARTGLMMATDADWAGMYSLTGEKRSRSGSYGEYDDMAVHWKSAFQQCKGSEYKPTQAGGDPDSGEPIISTSSAEAEVHGASDCAKTAMHFKHMCNEVDIPVPKRIPIAIDAGAAMGFINNTGTVGRMKHIDLRSEWVQTLRDREHLEFIKVPGEENPADFFTKILTGAKFKQYEDRMMKDMD